MTERGLTDLIICRIPGLSPVEKITLCKRFDREEDISVLSRRDVQEITGRETRRPWTMDRIRALAEADERTARLRGIARVSYRDAAYPPQLREIWDPPALLFYRGPLPDPFCPLLALVGTRKPSAPAAAAACRIAREMGEAGIPVVSGLALGIDAMAHRGNLEGGAPTVAVLGSGLDGIYPSSNRPLARRILDRGGVLLSEYPPGTAPQKWRFPARNRIVSGLARGVLIAEAPGQSGALITARFALEQGRDLWVASAGLSAAGTLRLKEEGAPVISSGREILKEWGIGFETEEETGEAVPFSGTRLAASLARELNIQM